MSKFIQVTDLADRTLALNVDNIVALADRATTTIITSVNSPSGVEVKQTFLEVLKLIEGEVEHTRPRLF
jgi:hypothetical protein